MLMLHTTVSTIKLVWKSKAIQTKSLHSLLGPIRDRSDILLDFGLAGSAIDS